MKVFQRFVLPFLSGILLWAAWPMSPLTFLIFFALVPLLYLESITKTNWRFFYLLYINFFIWNVGTTWWIWNASPGGAAGAIAVNSLLMTLPWLLFRFTKKQLGNLLGYASLIFYWLTFEYIHHNWDLSWPWLTLGNVFATSTNWIQWYQYTGTTGGSLWILLVNVLVFTCLPVHLFTRSDTEPFKVQGLKFKDFNPAIRYGVIAVLILVPILSSYLLAYRKSDDGIVPFRNAPNIVVVQPDVHVDPIDPSKDEKFNTDPAILIQQLIQLSETKIDTSTRLVIWPETSIPVEVWEDRILQNNYYQPIISFVQRHPQIQLVTGIDSYKNFGPVSNGKFSMHHDETSGTYYESYNTALGLDSHLQPQIYNKSKLVPGPESLPSWLSFLGPIFESLGGLSGTLGKSDSVGVFTAAGNPYRPAPAICYESIYSDYLTEYIRHGANVITVITNDGWWGNTPGYKQHENYARLRAIETGCWVARSANTGISCFIDPLGKVYQPQPWYTKAAIKMNVPINKTPTFYAAHGDYLSRGAEWAAYVLLGIAVVVRLALWKRNRSAKKSHG